MAERSEHLAENVNYDTKYIEITINIPRTREFKQATIVEQLDMYNKLWNIAKDIDGYSSPQNFHVIEFCQDGLPHLHGFIKYGQDHPIDEEELVMTITKSIYAVLPRAAKHQIAKNPYNSFYKRFKAPALCINCKSVLRMEWYNYVMKHQYNKYKSG